MIPLSASAKSAHRLNKNKENPDILMIINTKTRSSPSMFPGENHHDRLRQVLRFLHNQSLYKELLEDNLCVEPMDNIMYHLQERINMFFSQIPNHFCIIKATNK